MACVQNPIRQNDDERESDERYNGVCIKEARTTHWAGDPSLIVVTLRCFSNRHRTKNCGDISLSVHNMRQICRLPLTGHQGLFPVAQNAPGRGIGLYC